MAAFMSNPSMRMDSGYSDVQRYQIEVHGLKSASANIGAMDLSAMARAQENAVSFRLCLPVLLRHPAQQ